MERRMREPSAEAEPGCTATTAARKAPADPMHTPKQGQRKLQQLHRWPPRLDYFGHALATSRGIELTPTWHLDFERAPPLRRAPHCSSRRLCYQARRHGVITGPPPSRAAFHGGLSPKPQSTTSSPPPADRETLLHDIWCQGATLLARHTSTEKPSGQNPLACFSPYRRTCRPRSLHPYMLHPPPLATQPHRGPVPHGPRHLPPCPPASARQRPAPG